MSSIIAIPFTPGLFLLLVILLVPIVVLSLGFSQRSLLLIIWRIFLFSGSLPAAGSQESHQAESSEDPGNSDAHHGLGPGSGQPTLALATQLWGGPQEPTGQLARRCPLGLAPALSSMRPS